MAGGSITIIPQGKKIQGAYHAAGNAILYGATGGQLFVAGTVGQTIWSKEQWWHWSS